MSCSSYPIPDIDTDYNPNINFCNTSYTVSRVSVLIALYKDRPVSL